MCTIHSFLGRFFFAPIYLMFFFLPFLTKGQAELVLSTVEGNPGDTIYVDASLNNAGQLITALAVNVSFDPDLLTFLDAHINPEIGPESLCNKQLISSIPESGVFRFSLIPNTFTTSSLKTAIPDGQVVSISFMINPYQQMPTGIVLGNHPSASTSDEQYIKTIGVDGFINLMVTSVDEHISSLKNGLKLFQNYPNPFQYSTSIQYELPKRSHVQLEIFNVLGKRVAVLIDEVQNKGSYKVEWSNNDKKLPSGIYMYKLKTEHYSLERKMLFIQ